MRTFRTFKVFQNHVYAFHRTRSCEEIVQEPDSPPGTSNDNPPSEMDVDDQGEHQEHDSDQDHSIATSSSMVATPEEELKRSAAMSILKTRELHRLPMSVMDEIIADNQSLFVYAVSCIRERVCQELVEAGVSSSTLERVSSHLKETSPLVKIYGGLETQHQQTQYFHSHFQMVVSTTCDILGFFFLFINFTYTYRTLHRLFWVLHGRQRVWE